MTQTMHQRRAISRYRDLAPRHTHLRLCDAPQPVALPAESSTPRADRWAESAWRLHDGMPWVWALMSAVVLLASASIAAALIASAITHHSSAAASTSSRIDQRPVHVLPRVRAASPGRAGR
jgi:hypothetical protein